MKLAMISLESSFTMFMHTKMPKRWAYFIEIASYLKKYVDAINIMDCLDPKVSHGEILKNIAKEKYDLIILLARPETARSIKKIAPLIKQICSKSKILIYGDTANYVPEFFKDDSIDAIVENGDWECAIVDYINYIKGDIDISAIGGITCLENKTWVSAKKGKMVKDNLWSFPDIKSGFIDKNLIDLYLSITNGQMTITISRGCPFNCTFCPAVITFGENDRRIEPARVVEYMVENASYVKSFKLFSPTFTNDIEWVKNFCNLLIESNCKTQWVCTSRPDCLCDEEMIKLMSLSGCTKIALGVETLDEISNEGLRKFSHLDDYIGLVKNVFSTLIKYNIEPKPLMMLGLKGQTKNNIIASFDLLKSFGAKEIRAASYSPRQILRKYDKEGTLTLEQIEQYDKMTYQHIEIPGINREEYLNLIYNTPAYNNMVCDN